MQKSRILGVGHYVPERSVTNYELSEMMNTNHEWIVERTGIESRHWFTPGVDTVTSMSKIASEMALKRAGVQAAEIGYQKRLLWIYLCTFHSRSVYQNWYVQKDLGSRS